MILFESEKILIFMFPRLSTCNNDSTFFNTKFCILRLSVMKYSFLAHQTYHNIWLSALLNKNCKYLRIFLISQ